VALAINTAGWASLIWSAAYPHPLQLMVLITAALPWFALYMVSQSKGVLRLDRPRKADPYHPHVAYAIMMPGFGLTFRLMSDAHLLEWNRALWLSAAIALALWFVAIATDRSLSTRRGTMLALLLPAMFYGYGAGIGFNTAFDGSTPTVYSAQITRKYVVRGRHTDYNLALAPWGPRPESSTVSVSYGYYNSVQPGEFVCLAMRSGAFRIAWYQVVNCR
jgi:hypothetical protein